MLTGFLGSGKTTAIQHACAALMQKGLRVGVITNDQGVNLVDGNLFESIGIPARQVVNGCFCCNYKYLDQNIASLTAENNTDVIFAESVGSCTDIVATVLKPLQQFHPELEVAVSTFADIRLLKMMLNGKNSFDETVTYIYFKQLEDASTIVINKIDLVSTEELEEIKKLMHEKYLSKKIIYQNSLNADNVLHWLQVVENEEDVNANSLEIDYDVYAEGEAKLAWLDQSLEIFNGSHNVLQDALDIINGIHKKILDCGYAIGHLKFLLNNRIKISFTQGSILPVDLKLPPASAALLLLNLRVQTSPIIIKNLVNEVLAAVEVSSGCRIVSESIAAFQPGYPVPEYRM